MQYSNFKRASKLLTYKTWTDSKYKSWKPEYQFVNQEIYIYSAAPSSLTWVYYKKERAIFINGNLQDSSKSKTSLEKNFQGEELFKSYADVCAKDQDLFKEIYIYM